jgi:niacin transporter
MGAVLTALAIIIPIQFGFLKVIIPPFTATLASHVPMFLAMFISPTVALMVGIGSTLGFVLTSPLYVAARAASHIVVGYAGAVMVKRGFSMFAAFAYTLPIHAALEAIAVIPFGWTAYKVLVVTGVGTALHHTADAIIATAIIFALNRYMKLIPAQR